MLILMLMPEKVCWWLNTTKFFPFPSGCPVKWFQRCDVIFRITFSKIPQKIITNNLEQSVQWPGSCIQRGNSSPAVFYLYENCQSSRVFFLLRCGLKITHFGTWELEIHVFLRSASLLVEKHFCRIHYSFSICHSCQVIDLLLMTSQKCYFYRYLNFFNKKRSNGKTQLRRNIKSLGKDAWT